MENRYCTKCGAVLSPDDLYCQYCGQRTAIENATQTTYPSDDIRLEQYIGPNVAIFLQEFKKIEHGQKPKFHILAFLFALPYCYYRKCTSIFWKYLKLPYILLFVFNFLYTIILVYALLFLDRLQFTMTSLLLSLIQLWLSIFILIRCVKCGQHFYEAYYQQYCDARNANEDMTQTGGVSATNMILSLLVMFGIILVTTLVSLGIAFLILRSAIPGMEIISG